MIYGENTVPIEINKGLWLTQNSDTIPDGFCQEFKNLTVDVDGGVSLRGDLVALTPSAAATLSVINHGDYRTPPPAYYFQGVNYNAFYFANTVTRFPSVLTFYCDGVNINAYWVTGSADNPANRVSFQTQSFVLAGYVADACVYNDVYFALSTGAIYKLTGWTNVSTAIPALTATSVGSTGTGVHTLLSFQDRLFAFTASSIYFTELAPVGGSPEVWTSTNKINLGVTQKFGDCTSAIVLNNRIYIFTKAGAYVLYAKGDPTTWELQSISTDIRVPNKCSVAVVKNTLIWTDTTGIYAFDGVNSTSIGQPIDSILGDYNAASVFPFEDGFLVTLSAYTAAYNSGWTLSSSRMFYCDMNTWMELEVDAAEQGFGAARGVVLGTPRISSSMDIAKPRSFLVRVENSGSTYKIVTYHYTPEKNNLAKTGSLTTKDIKLNTTLVKRFIQGFLSYFTRVSSVSYQTKVDGGALSGTTVITVTGAADDSGMVKIGAPQFLRRFAARFLVSITTDSGRPTGPMFTFKELYMVGQTDGPRELDTNNG